MYIVATFYKFLNLPNIVELKEKILNIALNYQIKGTILLASEGVNATIVGKKEDMLNFYLFFKNIIGVDSLSPNEMQCDFMPFKKMKIRLKNEIVKLNKAKNQIFNSIINSQTGIYLNSTEWDNIMMQKDVILIDTRNYYEITFGSFKNAMNPCTENFSEITTWLEEELKDKPKDQKIAMFCTGGIRCEKSTAYVKGMGFNNVYHLKGGVLQYFKDKFENRIQKDNITASEWNESIEENSFWKGNLFVFDDRIAINQNLSPLMKQIASYIQ